MAKRGTATAVPDQNNHDSDVAATAATHDVAATAAMRDDSSDSSLLSVETMSSWVAASVFDGSGNLSAAFCGQCASYDILQDGTAQDVLHPLGLRHYLHILAYTSKYGLHWFAPPCCSWVFLTRVKSCRSRSAPQGATSDPWVVTHNAIATWVANAIFTAAATDIYFVIENPRGSLIFEFEPLKTALAQLGAKSVTVNLGDWGAPSLKPITLFGTAPWLQQLLVLSERRKSAEAWSSSSAPKRQKLATNINGRVTGNRDRLVASAAYPPEFCHEVAKLHIAHMNALHKTV